ncbi:MAG: SMC-Scp complex subunit ScpB [Vulcanimicrobiaceae bacterium]
MSNAAENGELNEESFAIDEAVESLRRPVEAVLFVASEALSIKQLAKLVRGGEIEVAATVQRIESEYADRGIVLREVAGGYRFATSPLAREAVEAYLLPPKHTLSVPALEALAIVAHLQPVTKSEIESIRGVNSDSVVSTLQDRNLIEESGRKDVVGRPMTYKTTKVFLESFGLNSTDDLPPLELEPGQPLELNLLNLQAAAAASPEEPALDDSAEGAGGERNPAPEDFKYEAIAAEETAFDDLVD